MKSNKIKPGLIYTIIFIMLLAACGPKTDQIVNGTNQGVPGDGAPGGQGIVSDDMEMPKSMQLMMGTFYLEGTDDAVTPQQASEMLLLWKGVRGLSDSETVSQAEINALYDQIEESLTKNQRKVVNGMEFAQEDLMTFMQEHNLSFGGGNQGDAASDDDGVGGGFGGGMPGGGGGPGGGMPGGGGGVPGGGMGGDMGGNFNPDAEGSDDSAVVARTFQLPPGIYDALIDLLTERAAE